MTHEQRSPDDEEILSDAVGNNLDSLERRRMEAEELLRRYTEGERDFSGIELYGEEFSDLEPPLCGCNLSGINLSHARIRFVESQGVTTRLED
ncbi:hypothetical protein K9N68_13365 [Kovacikia minuta CCNUW1]|uniref:hypothetical protein n=1 Tax=Kovacikia minuta TaxID=2931930 RepID=UPI001CCA6E63|nr:hypothetical protein [Kovacikia minuta]UBF28741.1 hypothetical protein K9N68_13365 [Kovacikia minuta CCNUW1]